MTYIRVSNNKEYDLKEIKITIRIEKATLTAIDDAMISGRFENRSHLVRLAIKEFLFKEGVSSA
jgi:Arc/MetJ-type ribon-helix-helix transcriptional regulator